MIWEYEICGDSKIWYIELKLEVCNFLGGAGGWGGIPNIDVENLPSLMHCAVENISLLCAVI